MNLSVQELRVLIAYNAETGEFSWLRVRNGQRRNGNVGAIDNGYLRICIAGRLYRAHRVAWALTHGDWPSAQIDHINGNKLDNRMSNLRIVSNAENGQNVRKARSSSKSGALGVVKYGNRFCAYIWHGGKQRYVGGFDSPEAASAAYFTAKQQLHAGYVS